uniref:Uncharacterized protein n=1 Tax=Sinocyclocheilus rhinocerous TaxID=307959 RepID=A0A673N6G3_9TELE
MASLSEDDFSCPVCHEIFKAPVLLSCSHSFCKECLQQFWRIKGTEECPVCRRRSSNNQPPLNLALQNLCESFLKERKERRSSGSGEICNLHGNKLELFCLEDKQPVCLVCRDSQQHDNHKFRPISEVVPSYKKLSNIRYELHTITHMIILQKSLHTEHQIKQQFEKLHQFLRDEEEATITALREEEEQKKQMMTDLIRAGSTDTFWSFDPCAALLGQPALQSLEEDAGHRPEHGGKSVILDPNTAHPHLVLTDDLTSVRNSGKKQPVPDNPERFDSLPCVLGSEGFNSGTHCWDVEVKQSPCWHLGVTTASNQRKGPVFFNADVWCLKYHESPFLSLVTKFGFCVEQKLDRVRVNLDCDRGTVSFSDPVTNTHLHTFTTTFTNTVLPFFCCYGLLPLKILPFDSQ